MTFRLILALGLGVASSASAQDNQDPLQVARANDVCNGNEVLTARFEAPGVLAVRCGDAPAIDGGTANEGGALQGGLGTAAGIGLAALTVVFLASSGGDSSSTSDTQ